MRVLRLAFLSPTVVEAVLAVVALEALVHPRGGVGLDPGLHGGLDLLEELQQAQVKRAAELATLNEIAARLNAAGVTAPGVGTGREITVTVVRAGSSDPVTATPDLELKPGTPLDETVVSRQFGVSRSPVREALIRSGANAGKIQTVPDRADFDPMPWQSMAVWMLTQMKRWGYIKGNVDYKQIAEKVFLITDARKHMKELGHEFAATTPYPKHKIMGKEFDPAKPEEYLKSFAINKMIAAMTGKQAKVLGKPSRIAFDAAVAAMGLPRAAARDIVVFGDDPALEMRMARGAGAVGVGLTTGLMKRDALATLPESQQPHLLIDDYAPVMRLFA